MVSALIVTSDTAHAAYTNTKAAIEGHGHTTTAVLDSDLASASLTGVDVIVSVRASGTSGTVAPWLSARWAEGYPILVGGPEAGSVSASTAHSAQEVGILASPRLRDSTAAYSSVGLIITVAHDITAGFSPGSTAIVLAGHNWSERDEGTPWGTVIGEIGGDAPGDYLVAVEAGDAINAGAPHAPGATAPARAVFCGWLYAGQTDYTADGKTIISQALEWVGAPTGEAVDVSVVEHTVGAVGAFSTTYALSLTATPQAGDAVVLRVTHRRSGQTVTGVSGLGATWTQVAWTDDTEKFTQVWIGTGATSSGTVTATFNGSTWAQGSVTLARGLTSTAVTYATANAHGSGTVVGPALDAAKGQFVLATAYSGVMTAFTPAAPASGWSADAIISEPNGAEIGHAHRIPSEAGTTSHRCDVTNSNSTTGQALVVVIGEPEAAPTVVAAGVATEVNSVPTGTSIVTAGTAVETDVAPPATFVGDQILSAGVATETDTVPAPTPIAPSLTVDAGVATEADTAPGATTAIDQVVAAGVATETDSAIAGDSFDVTPVTIDVTGSGALYVEDEVIVPDFQMMILDPVLLRAPTVVAVALFGGAPSRQVKFYLDETHIWTTTTNTDGSLEPTSINIGADVGTQGTHTLEARLVTLDGTLLTSAADFQLRRGPTKADSAMGADAQAVEVPGAVSHNTRHWVLQDLLAQEEGGIGSYILPNNPPSMTSPHYEHALTARRTTAKNGQFHVFQAGQMPKPWEFSGYCPTEEMAEKLLEYRDLNRRFYVIDHRNRAWKVVFTEVDITPRLQHTFNGVVTDWGSDYTVRAIIFDQEWVSPA